MVEKIEGVPEKSDAQKKQELERLKQWVKKILPEDYDKFDVDQEYDRTISYDENKGCMRNKLKLLITDLRAQKDYTKAQQEKLEDERIKQAEKEVEQYNESISFEETKGIEEFYAPIKRGVQKLCQGYSNLLFIRGRGGIGKSYQIRKALVENKGDFVEIAGDVTEAYLYRLIFENNGKILWFKDVVKLLQSLGSMNLLKSATETEEQKVLTKSNYSKDQDDLPDKFLCKCKFIFDYNNLFGSQLKQDFEALATRGDYREIPFSDEDIKVILKAIAKDDWQKEVTEEVIKNFESNGMVKLNLRTQWKAFRSYEYAKKNGLDWKEVLADELKNISRIRSLLYSLIGNKAIKSSELKKLLLRQEYVGTIRSADNKINEWLYLEELYKWSESDKAFFVSINPRPNNKV